MTYLRWWLNSDFGSWVFQAQLGIRLYKSHIFWRAQERWDKYPFLTFKLYKRANIGKSPNIFSKVLAVQIHSHAGTYSTVLLAEDGTGKGQKCSFVCQIQFWFLWKKFYKEDIKAEFGLCPSDPCLAPVFYNWNFNRIRDSWDWIPVTMDIQWALVHLLYELEHIENYTQLQKTSRSSTKLQDFRDFSSTTPQAVDKSPHPALPFSSPCCFVFFFFPSIASIRHRHTTHTHTETPQD